jgi:hypothetical protein
MSDAGKRDSIMRAVNGTPVAFFRIFSHDAGIFSVMNIPE